MPVEADPELMPVDAADLEHVAAHTSGLWQEIRGRRIFITGGTGFFGRWLLETFAFVNDRSRLGAELVCLTRDPEGFRRKAPHLAVHPSIRLWAGDVRDFEFPPGNFSFVIHGATTSGAPVEDREMLDTIVSGTMRALEFAGAARVEKFLYLSSGAVYGKQPPEISHVPESYQGIIDSTDPVSVYGKGKREAERLCEECRHRHGVGIKIARGFAFVGPYLPLDAHFAIGNFIRDTLAGRSVCVQGDGTPFRSYLYAADLAVWLWTILFRGRSLHPYNVGSDEAIAIADLAHLVADTAAPGTPVRIQGTPSSGPASRYVPDIGRARDELGLRPWISLPDAVRRTVLFASRSLPK